MLDRLLELENQKHDKCDSESEWLKYNEEYDSLKKEIQGLIEKGKLWDNLADESVTEYEIKITNENKALKEKLDIEYDVTKTLQKLLDDKTEQVKNITTDRDIVLREKHNALKGIDNLKEQVKQLREDLGKCHDSMEELVFTQSERDQLKSKIEKVIKECNDTIQAYEHLNESHQQKYEKTKDDSYLSTINRNNDLINENKKIKEILGDKK